MMTWRHNCRFQTLDVYCNHWRFLTIHVLFLFFSSCHWVAPLQISRKEEKKKKKSLIPTNHEEDSCPSRHRYTPGAPPAPATAPPPSALRFVSFVCVCVRENSASERNWRLVTCKTTEREKRSSGVCLLGTRRASEGECANACTVTQPRPAPQYCGPPEH